MKKIICSVAFFLLITINLSLNAQAQELETQIINSITIGADYIANSMLDETGKSRCDYNLTEGKWYDYEPPWHTGQAIYALCRAYQVTKNEDYLEAAKKAGDWWISLEEKEHPRLKGMLRAIHGDHAGDVIVFATVSDGTAGLFHLYELSGDKKYAEVATRAGQWMLENMYVPEHGVFYDNVNPETGEVIKENSPFWPDKEKQRLFDVSRPNNEGSLYKDMYHYTKNEKYKKVFLELCESLVEKQDEYGLWMEFMPNHKEEGAFHPRFNLWYAESLLEGYDLTGDTKYLESAQKTAARYAGVQKKDGTIYYKNYVHGGENRNSICGSAVAFAGMIWLRLIQYDVGAEFADNLDLALHWILVNRFTADHPDSNIAGATINTRTRHRKGKLWITNRDIGTSFAVRFLADYYEYLQKNMGK